MKAFLNVAKCFLFTQLCTYHPFQVYRKASPQDGPAKLDPVLADGWLNALVEDGLVFTADKARPPYSYI